MTEKKLRYNPERDEAKIQVFRDFQELLESPLHAKHIADVIGGMGPKERVKFYPLIKLLRDRTTNRVMDKGLSPPGVKP